MLTFPIHRLSDWLTDCDLALQVAISLGLTPFEVVRRLATNADFDTSEDVLIWPPGTAYTLPTAAAQIYISSSSGSDTTQTVTIEYLDASYVAKTVTKALAGQTKTTVTGATDVFRVNKVYVDAATAGNVWVYFDDTVTAGVPQTASKQLGYVPLGYMASRQAIYTVPAGYYALLWDVSATVAASATGKSFDAHCYKKIGSAAATLLTALTPVSTATNTQIKTFSPPEKLTAGTDLYVKSENASADNTYIETEFTFWLIPTGKVE